MKTILLAACAATLAAQTWGYNTYATPNGIFGATPNAMGGYNYTNQYGAPIGSSRRNALGGYTYSDQLGGYIGSSMPNGYGGYTFRYGY
jgi:hypothetical protein